MNAEQLDGIYKTDKDHFRIGESDQFYFWDAENKSLVYTDDLKVTYAIPY